MIRFHVVAISIVAITSTILAPKDATRRLLLVDRFNVMLSPQRRDRSERGSHRLHVPNGRLGSIGCSCWARGVRMSKRPLLLPETLVAQTHARRGPRLERGHVGDLCGVEGGTLRAAALRKQAYPWPRWNGPIALRNVDDVRRRSTENIGCPLTTASRAELPIQLLDTDDVVEIAHVARNGIALEVGQLQEHLRSQAKGIATPFSRNDEYEAQPMRVVIDERLTPGRACAPHREPPFTGEPGQVRMAGGINAGRISKPARPSGVIFKHNDVKLRVAGTMGPLDLYCLGEVKAVTDPLMERGLVAVHGGCYLLPQIPRLAMRSGDDRRFAVHRKRGRRTEGEDRASSGSLRAFSKSGSTVRHLEL